MKDQAEGYLFTHPVTLLHGLDIGGGTPSALNPGAFAYLLAFSRDLRNTIPLSERFEDSVEISFSTVDKRKIKLLGQYGVSRVSAGLQVFDRNLLEQQSRTDIRLTEMKDILCALHDNGISKVNPDLMYGLNGQTMDMLSATLDVIEVLYPEQVTVYETRYNMNRMSHTRIDRKVLFQQYSYMYHRLVSIGYHAAFGQNTFSLTDDQGVSSYLYSRMYDCILYKGFGISAQSMSRQGISCNILKNASPRVMPERYTLTEEDVYLCPRRRLLQSMSAQPCTAAVSACVYLRRFLVGTLKITMRMNWPF